jgi:HSP20 family protein
MSFGFAPLSYSPFGFGHGFVDPFVVDPFFELPSRSYFVRETHPYRHLRRAADRAPSALRLTRPALPSLLDLISVGSDLGHLWDSFEKNLSNQQVAKIEAKPEAAAASSSSSLPPTQIEGAALAPSEETVLSPKLGAVDVKRIDTGTHFDIHLPGLSVGDIKLDFDFKRHTLSLKAEKKMEEEKQSEHGKRSIVRHVSISRSLPLPDGAKPEDVTADFVNGVLSIVVNHKAIEAPISLPIHDSSKTITDAPTVNEKINSEKTESADLATENSAPSLEAFSSAPTDVPTEKPTAASPIEDPAISSPNLESSTEAPDTTSPVSATEGCTAGTEAPREEKETADFATVEDAE